MATIETGYSIHKPSQDLYINALRTIPVTPIHAEMTFLAEGLEAPFTRGQEEIARYMQECTVKGIVPYSVTNIEIRDGKIFRNESSVEPPTREDSESLKEAAVFSRFNRTREHKVHLNFHIHAQWGSYDAIRDRYLDQLLNLGYQIGRTELWLSSYHLSGYNDGDYPATKVTINEFTGNEGIKMRLSRDESKVEDLDSLRSWFRDLKQPAPSK